MRVKKRERMGLCSIQITKPVKLSFHHHPGPVPFFNSAAFNPFLMHETSHPSHPPL